MAEFPDWVVEEAWKRSGQGCECTRVTHPNHIGRCNKILLWTARGNRESIWCWETHSKSGLHLIVPSDCEILCCECHYQTF